tara:strand:- start:16 stop:636 length:621 start_codon:yes stop_codon:yes gene_type:complete
MNLLEQQALALAGIFQAAEQVEQLALSGSCDKIAFDCSLNSIFSFDAATTEEVFGDLDGLQCGFSALVAYLGGSNDNSGKNIAYYALSMLKIAKRLTTDPVLSEKLLQNLQTMETRSREFDLGKNSLVARIDGLYQDTISSLQPRIIVRGEQLHLRNNENAGKIRSMLFAGIRSAVLWQQLGGSKWKLLWQRKAYVDFARQFIQQG